MMIALCTSIYGYLPVELTALYVFLTISFTLDNICSCCTKLYCKLDACCLYRSAVHVKVFAHAHSVLSGSSWHTPRYRNVLIGGAAIGNHGHR